MGAAPALIIAILVGLSLGAGGLAGVAVGGQLSCTGRRQTTVPLRLSRIPVAREELHVAAARLLTVGSP
jgi:hypothetical protein